MGSNTTSTFEAHVQTLEARWWAALEDAGYDAAVIAAGQMADYYQDDHAPPYRANPDFAQWLPGDDTAGGFLVVRAGRPTLALLYAPKDYWHAPPSRPDWAEPAMEVRQFAEVESQHNAVVQALSGSARALLASQTPFGNFGCQAHNDLTVLHAVRFARAEKTLWELEQMRAASRAGARGHIAAAQAFHAGGSEFDINVAFLTASAQHAEALPYHSIIALNEHAGVLHYQHYERAAPEQHRSFLIDAGARTQGYASDITRTYAAQDDEFAALVQDFDVRQQALVEEVRAGRSYVDLHARAHRAVGDTLAAFDFVRCDGEQAVACGITHAFLPHGLGHLLGIQVHDVGGHQLDAAGTHGAPPDAYPALRLTRDIAPGQVFTIEPGLYFIPMLLDELRQSDAGKQVNWARVEAFLPYGGIRIEDNVHVLEDGVENLTRDAFAEVAGD